MAKTSQKEIVRKPQDSILEKQIPMVFAAFFTGCFLLTHMDGGDPGVVLCTKTLLAEAADAEDLTELFIAKAMGCP